MKASLQSFLAGLAIVLLVNLLAVAAGVLWLWQSDRLSRQRVHRVIEIFRPTLAEEAELEKKAQEAQAQALQHQQRLIQMMAAEKGPLSAEERIRLETRDDQLLRLRLQRLEDEKNQLLQQLEQARQTLARQQEELTAQRKAFEQTVQAELKRRSTADFQLAVQMYEQLPPRLAKQMFQELLRQNRQDQVLDYLAAMQLRKAAAILKEFKDPTEVQQAADLVQRLRERGIDPLNAPAGGRTTPAPSSASANPTQPSAEASLAGSGARPGG